MYSAWQIINELGIETGKEKIIIKIIMVLIGRTLIRLSTMG